VVFRTKPQIALELVDRALANGVRVQAWTFDELYGRDSALLDGLHQRQQMFVAEVPTNFHAWLKRPRVLRRGWRSRRGRRRHYPRLAAGQPSSPVQNLLRYSPVFRRRRWQRYRIKDTTRGPEVWEVKWAVCWRKGSDGLPSRRHCLLVARHVLTQEVKYFLANRVPGEPRVTLRQLLRIAFGRWSVENCFRQAKEELGLDHYEVRGWRCVHRHFYLTQLSHLFCARIRQKFDARIVRDDPLEHLTTAQVRRAINTWLQVVELRLTKTERLHKELATQYYYQKRNAQSRRSHTTTRKANLKAHGIDAERIKSCLPPACA
jgi:SRSO17 transposase